MAPPLTPGLKKQREDVRKDILDQEIDASDKEAEKKSKFSWTQCYDASLKAMNELCWLLYPENKQGYWLGPIIDTTAETRLPSKIYECWWKLFDYCKFWLHNFDQGMRCAWLSPRWPIPMSLVQIKTKLIDLVDALYLIEN